MGIKKIDIFDGIKNNKNKNKFYKAIETFSCMNQN